MKVYVLIRDESDYNGDRSVAGVFTTYNVAKQIADWETEKSQDWINSMRELGDKVGDWVPQFIIEEADFFDN